MRDLVRKFTGRTADSYKVQSLLYRLGFRDTPPGVQSIEIPLLYREWENLIPPRDLWPNSKDDFVHYIRWAFEYRAYLTLLCGMRQDASVLELGCNHGRTMLALVDYLRPPGRYEGLDIRLREIEFAQRHVHKTYPLFNFTYADIYNQMYNSQGRQSAETFRFPYSGASFDIVFAASLFTHLLPPAALNYFKESRRVLRGGGRCLFSFLALDYYRGRGPLACFDFPHSLEGFERMAVHDKNNPEAIIAYEISLINEMAAEAGLRVRRVIPGYWSDMQKLSVNEQDLFLLEAV